MADPSSGAPLSSDSEDSQDGRLKQYVTLRGRRIRTRMATIVDFSDEDEPPDTTTELTRSESMCSDFRESTSTDSTFRDSTYEGQTSNDTTSRESTTFESVDSPPGRLKRSPSARSTAMTADESDPSDKVHVKRRRLHRLRTSQDLRADSAGSVEGQPAEGLSTMATPGLLSELGTKRRAISMSDLQKSVTISQQRPVADPKEQYYKDEILGLLDRLATSHVQNQALQRDAENVDKCRATIESQLRMKIHENKALRRNVSALEEELQSVRQEEEDLLQARLDQARPEDENREEEVAEAYLRAEEAEAELKELRLSFKVGQIDSAMLQHSLATAKAAKVKLQQSYDGIKEAGECVIQHWGTMAGANLGPAGEALQKLKTMLHSE